MECARKVEVEENDLVSEIFSPHCTELGGFTNGQVTLLEFFMADVESFVRPVAVIPDIGGQANAYFVLKDRTEWKADFEAWLESSHDDDGISDESSESSSDDCEESGQSDSDSNSSDAFDQDTQNSS